MAVDAAAAKSVFLAALEKTDPAERSAFLDQACAGDAALRARIEELLTAHESGSFPDFLGDAAPAFEPTQSVVSTPNDPTQTRDGTTHAGGISLAFLAPPRDPANLGRLDHYEVQAVLGQGGMGVVLKAFDESLDRIVAIKVLGSQYAANGTARRRFIREAKAVAAVTHEHVVHVYAVDERVPYLVMQYIKGVSLQERIDQKGPLELKEILRIGMQIAYGLAAAHAQGIVHRDIKPSNILLENGIERVKLTDFGLARAVDDASVTQSGVIAGTPMYMSPEQARGEQVDPRSDLFSLGSVLYAMCTGHAPFRASGTMAVMKRVIEDSPRSVCEQNAEIPDWLEAIVFKLLEKRPEDRFQSAKEIAALFEQHLAHLQQPSTVAMPARVDVPRAKSRPVKARRSHGWIIAVVVAAILLVTCVPVLLIGGFYLFWASGGSSDQPLGPVASSGRVTDPARRGNENLRIELDDQNLRLDLESEQGEPFSPPHRGIAYAFPLRPGRYHVRAYRPSILGDVLVFQQWVDLKDGETQTLRVDSSWTQLFNGRKLTGWKVFPAERESWTVNNGILTAQGLPSHLFSERADFGSFHLRVEMRVNKSGASGQFVRVPFEDPAIVLSPHGDDSLYKREVPALYGKDATPIDPAPPRYRPSALTVWGVGKRGRTWTHRIPENEWFVQEIIADGKNITIKLPEYDAFSVGWPDAPTGGHLALQLFDPDSVVEFRKIEIKELSADSKAAAVAAELQRLQGQWQTVVGEAKGELVPQQELVSILGKGTFKGKQYEMTIDGQPLFATIEIDPTKNPKQIDFVIGKGPAIVAGQRMRGIYSLSGNILQLCIAPAGGERPTEFVSKPDGAWLLIVAHRKAAEKDDGFISLFNGKDLNGWRWVPEKDVADAKSPWELNGELLMSKGKISNRESVAGYLRTEKAYRNYRFELEWRMPGAIQGTFPNTSLRLHLSEPEPGKPTGIETRFKVGTNRLSLYKTIRLLGSATGEATEHPVVGSATGEWNKVVVTSQDGKIDVTFNGKPAASLTGCKPESGFIALQTDGHEFHFRNIRIKELPAEKQALLTLTPPKVLQHMVGTWEIEYAAPGGPPKAGGAKGKYLMIVEPIAGGQFYRILNQSPSGDPSGVVIDTFDKDRWEFLNWYFDASGFVSNTAAGRFDSASNTLTMTSVVRDNFVQVSQQKIIDADTADFTVTVRDKMSRVVFEMNGKAKRLPAGKAPGEATGPQQTLPKEMELLDRLVGTWETEMASKVRPNDKWKTEVTSRKILGGRYIEQRERIVPSGEENYTLTTFDPPTKKYRQWYFSSRWPQAEGTGTWDEASQTMTWDCEGGAGTTTPIKTSMVWKFASADKTDFHIVVKDKQGKVLEDVEGTHKRRPPPK